MSVPLLDVQHGDFDRRNLLLQLALGLECAGLRLDALLDRHAPAHAGGAPPPANAEDPLLLCILGLVSVRTKLRAHLEAAAGEVPDATPSDDAPQGDPREVLR